MRFLSTIFIFLMLFLTGCGFQDARPPQAEHCRIAEKIIDQYVRDVWDDYLICVGGGGEYLGQINKITLIFETMGPLPQKDLRALILVNAERFLERINNDKEVRPYLANYPFQPKNLKYMIALTDQNQKPIRNKGSSKELLYSVALLNGKLIYSISNEETIPLQVVHRETYMEAIEAFEESLKQQNTFDALFSPDRTQTMKTNYNWSTVSPSAKDLFFRAEEYPEDHDGRHIERACHLNIEKGIK